jgi:hypothetical protein
MENLDGEGGWEMGFGGSGSYDSHALPVRGQHYPGQSQQLVPGHPPPPPPPPQMMQQQQLMRQQVGQVNSVGQPAMDERAKMVAMYWRRLAGLRPHRSFASRYIQTLDKFM